MSRKTHAVGDHVVLKAGLSRTATGARTCRIVGVRLDNENFERRVVHSDIDADETAAPAARKTGTTAAGASKSGPWLKPSSIRIGK